MARHRRAARIDKNQKDIVDQLRQIPGVQVELDHDDILVGYKGHTYWFEIKSERAANKQGKVFDCELKDSQKKLRDGWPGHYSIVSSLDQILEEIGITTQ